MIRRGAHGDVTFMRSMLSHAYHWRVAGLDAPIPLARYTENWGREGDVAVIAMEGGNRLGAAWLRLFPASAPGYGFVDEQTPELTISVVPSRRRHGLGQRAGSAYQPSRCGISGASGGAGSGGMNNGFGPSISGGGGGGADSTRDWQRRGFCSSGCSPARAAIAAVRWDSTRAYPGRAIG